jgi:hypothetical protein
MKRGSALIICAVTIAANATFAQTRGADFQRK